MKAKFCVSCIFLSFFIIGLYGSQQAPIIVSPGSDAGIAMVGEACPTFSWTAVNGAAAYRIEVFEAFDENVLSYVEIVQDSQPFLVKEIQGAATSWTPSSEEALANGVRYIWYVQAIDAYGNGAWSTGKMFRVKVGAGFSAVEDALGETLEDHGISEDVISDVIFDLRTGEVKGEGGQAEISGSLTPIRVQGNETGTNTYYGENAGFSLTTGVSNSFFGNSAGYSYTSAVDSTFVGYHAGYSTTVASNNTFLGSQSGYLNTNGPCNTFVGRTAGYSNSTGANNTSVGYRAGYSNSSGYGNTFIGREAGYTSTGAYNTFVGFYAGGLNSSGSQNIFLGYCAGAENSGSCNTFIGNNAGRLNSSGDYNVFLGHQVGFNETGSNKLYIDNSNTADPLIYGEFDNNILAFMGTIGIGTKSPAYPMEMKKTGANASFVVDRTDGATNFINATQYWGNFGTVNNYPLRLVTNAQWHMRLDSDRSLTMRNGATCTAGGVWTNASSRELKENIHDISINQALNALDELQPVSYNYKADKGDEHLGFIAEDVPALVASKDRKGMSPMDVVAVLTKVLQEQQKINEELRAEIAELKGRINQDK